MGQSAERWRALSPCFIVFQQPSDVLLVVAMLGQSQRQARTLLRRSLAMWMWQRPPAATKVAPLAAVASA